MELLAKYGQLVVFIVVIGGILATVLYFRAINARAKTTSRKDELDSENTLTTYLTNQINGFKKIVDDQNKSITDMGKELAALTAVVGEKDKQIKNLQATLNLRNPEMEVFMQTMLQAAKDGSETHKKIVEILQEIHGTSKANNEALNADKSVHIEGTMVTNKPN